MGAGPSTEYQAQSSNPARRPIASQSYGAAGTVTGDRRSEHSPPATEKRAGGWGETEHHGMHAAGGWGSTRPHEATPAGGWGKATDTLSGHGGWGEKK